MQERFNWNEWKKSFWKRHAALIQLWCLYFRLPLIVGFAQADLASMQSCKTFQSRLILTFSFSEQTRRLFWNYSNTINSWIQMQKAPRKIELSTSRCWAGQFN